MKFILALISLATAALAVDTHLVVWENANYSTEGGAYKEFVIPSAACKNFNGVDAWWNDRVSYIQINPNQRCQFWDDLDCKGASLVVNAGSGGYVGKIPDNHNDKISSFACFK